MIVSKIYGGLAGQMLQYALGRALSLKYKTKLCLDISWFDINIEDQGGTPRSFGLHKFNTKYKIYKRNSFVKLGKLVGIMPRLQTKTENGFAYNIETESWPDNIIIDGYWFSYRYFDHIFDVLVEDFYPKKIDLQNTEMLQKIKSNSQSVALHIRRGDYVSNTNANKFHGVMGMDYYNAALSKVNEYLNNPHFFIFTDDFNWVKQNFNSLDNKTYVDFNGDANNHMDIYLMSQCKHNIIANSGFSWWGAYLNQNHKKIVIAPASWFQNNSYNTSDLKPGNWLSI